VFGLERRLKEGFIVEHPWHLLLSFELRGLDQVKGDRIRIRFKLNTFLAGFNVLI
jgi:hypothetical protein